MPRPKIEEHTPPVPPFPSRATTRAHIFATDREQQKYEVNSIVNTSPFCLLFTVLRQMYRRRLQESKHKKVQSWEKKTNRSPFLINLLAEVKKLPPRRFRRRPKKGFALYRIESKNGDKNHCNAIYGRCR